MCESFSTRDAVLLPCVNPVLTVSFPRAAAAGNTVVLANGAVVDLNELGRIIGRFCFGFDDTAKCG